MCSDDRGVDQVALLVALLGQSLEQALQPPDFDQRDKRVYTLCHGP